MGDKSGISWCGPTWNPWVGCIKKSTGCKACYMYREMERYGQDPRNCRRTAAQTFNRPLRWAREVEEGKRDGIDRVVFTCSWSDFFNPEADPWRADAWEIIRRTIPRLKYLILTKLPERIEDHLPAGWLGNDGPWEDVGLGTSVENREASWRVKALRAIPARMRFLSLEPLLESLGAFSFSEIEWLLIGGESASTREGARPFNPRWGDEVQKMAAAGVWSRGDGAATAIHWKQYGSNPVNDLGEPIPIRHRHGSDPSEWPECRRIQSFPPGWVQSYKPPRQASLFQPRTA